MESIKALCSMNSVQLESLNQLTDNLKCKYCHYHLGEHAAQLPKTRLSNSSNEQNRNLFMKEQARRRQSQLVNETIIIISIILLNYIFFIAFFCYIRDPMFIKI